MSMLRSQTIALLLSFATPACGGEGTMAAETGRGDAQLQAADPDQAGAPVPDAGDETPALAAPDAPAAGATTALAAAFDPATYLHYEAIYPFPGTWYGYGYGPVACPAGTKLAAMGVTSSDPKSMIMNGTPFLDWTGAFASAWGRGGYEVQVSARCVNAAQVQNAKTAIRALRNHGTGWRTFVQRATCPDGTIAYAGGGSVQVQGSPAVNGLYQIASIPSTDAREWIYAGAGDLGTSTLVVGAQCLPRSELGSIVTVRETVAAPAGAYNPVIYVGARCPAGYFAMSGGAFIHRAGSLTPEWLGYLTVSNMAADDQGWFARAWTFQEGAQLTSVVRCVTRPFSG